MTKIKNTLKKGFTLTELAIVIAVIAILVAVLVPTFISLINSANETNDVITVRNLNTILSTNTDDIDKPTDALQLVYEDGGYSVANMTPKSDGEIVYDELTTSFVFVYEDNSTYPESATTNLSAYTTWKFVSTSDISPDSDGIYHFETSDYKNNSIILKGSDWAGKTVYANYGVELWNDSDTTTELAELKVVNTDNQVQSTSTASANVKLANTAVKTADNTSDSTRQLIVNAKAKKLTYGAGVYDISDYSTVSVILTISGSKTYYQYGTTAAYDLTSNANNAQIKICSEEQAKKIEEGEVIVVKPSDSTTSASITDDTEKLTTDQIDSISSVTVNSGETVTITVTEEAVTITIIDSSSNATTTEIVIGDDSETQSWADYQTATTDGLGTEKYPYLIYDEDDFYAIYTNTSTDCIYYRLENNLNLTTTWSNLPNDAVFNASFSLDGNGYTIEGLFVTDYGTLGDITIINTIFSFSRNNCEVNLDTTGTITLSNCVFNGTYTSNEVYGYSQGVYLLDMDEVIIEDCTFNNVVLEIYAENYFGDTSTQTELNIDISSTEFTYTLSGDVTNYNQMDYMVHIFTDADYCKVNNRNAQFTVNVTLGGVSFSGNIQYGIYCDTSYATNETLNFDLNNVNFESSFDHTKDTTYTAYTVDINAGSDVSYTCPALVYVTDGQRTNNNVTYKETVNYDKIGTLTSNNCTFTWKNDTIDTELNVYNNIYANLTSSATSDN